jgi:hypothetical protein
MAFTRVIGIRTVAVGGSSVTVVLSQNESGTVSGQCLLDPTERPIIDGPTVSSVLQTVEQILEAVLLSRGRKS